MNGRLVVEEETAHLVPTKELEGVGLTLGRICGDINLPANILVFVRNMFSDGCGESAIDVPF